MQTKEQKISESIKKVKEAYDKFLDNVERAGKEYSGKIQGIMKRIEERRIRQIREEITK